MTLTVAALPFLAAIVLAALHIGIVQIIRNAIAALGLGLLGGLTVMAAGLWLAFVGGALPPGAAGWGRAITLLLCYFGFVFAFWVVLNLNITAIRIRILKELWATPGQRLSAADLASLYDSRKIAARRIERLEKTGHLEVSGGRVYVRRGLIPGIDRLVRFVRDIVIPRRR